MPVNDSTSRGSRSSWAAASPARKISTIVLFVAVIGIIVLIIAHNMAAIFNAGQRVAQ